jgi:hypothetical protein
VIGLGLVLAAVFVGTRWEGIWKWYRPPAANLPDATRIAEMRASVSAAGSRGRYETDLPEFVVPDRFVRPVWARFVGSEYVAKPPISPDEPLGVITVATRSGDVVRVTFFESGTDRLVFTLDGHDYFQTEPRDVAEYPLGGGNALVGVLRNASMFVREPEN